MIKVNLGCGTKTKEDWINLDYSLNAKLAYKYPKIRYILFRLKILNSELYQVPWGQHNIMIHDVRKGLPFDDNSINYIYSSHMIEHLTKAEAIELLNECFRVLIKRGVIRLATPDLFKLVNNYLDDYKNNYTQNRASEKFLSSLGILNNNRKWYLRFFYDHHKWLYDEKSMISILEAVGFINIKRREYKKGEVPDIEYLDNRPESLFIEATKP